MCHGGLIFNWNHSFVRLENKISTLLFIVKYKIRFVDIVKKSYLKMKGLNGHLRSQNYPRNNLILGRLPTKYFDNNRYSTFLTKT